MFCPKCGFAWSPLKADTIDAMLASEPMQAIRAALRTLEEYGGPNYLAHLQLPTSVVDWVMGS